MNKTPRIGLTPYLDRQYGHHMWMRDTYVNAIYKAGGMPCILPYAETDEQFERIVGSMDGFLFTGGEDIGPANYGQDKSPLCGEVLENRDAYDLRLAKMIIEADKPLVGICRGSQIINVAMGGTLIQDIPSMVSSDICHDQEKDFEKTTHKIRIRKDSRLYECIGKEEFFVNTWHHQAVDTPGKGIIVSASAPDGITEAIEMPEKRLVLAVQWHPEYCTDTENIGFFKAVVEEARRNG